MKMFRLYILNKLGKDGKLMGLAVYFPFDFSDSINANKLELIMPYIQTTRFEKKLHFDMMNQLGSIQKGKIHTTIHPN
jgi:hypothetical protein